MAENEQTIKPTPADQQGKDQPGMLGDGTQEQNLDRPGDKGARITGNDLKQGGGRQDPER